ncbi:MAG TPA: XRE family transcriptional regulator [Steroidobacteraceae bacterium]|nr:XRE family transcriptional regulator [Steroidobacteraceae bacterium]
MTRHTDVAAAKAAPPAGPKKSAPDLSARIKEICRSRGLSLRQLAALTGIPVATLSKVQNNLATLNYEQLSKLAGGLGIELNELFTSASSDVRTGRRAVTHKGQGLKEVSERFDFELLCGELANRSMNPAIMEIRARSLEEAGGLIVHEGEEFAYVLTGAIEVYSEHYVPTRLEAGASIYIDSTSGHAYVNVSDEPISRVLAVTTHFRNVVKPLSQK